MKEKVSIVLCLLPFGITLAMGHYLIAIVLMIIGAKIHMHVNNIPWTACTYEEKKPYYKDSFEEFQHFKIVNKGMFASDVKGFGEDIINSNSVQDASDAIKDFAYDSDHRGLYNHEKINIVQDAIKDFAYDSDYRDLYNYEKINIAVDEFNRSN